MTPKHVFWPPYTCTHVDMHLHAQEHIHTYITLDPFFLFKVILVRSFTQQICIVR